MTRTRTACPAQSKLQVTESHASRRHSTCSDLLQCTNAETALAFHEGSHAFVLPAVGRFTRMFPASSSTPPATGTASAHAPISKMRVDERTGASVPLDISSIGTPKRGDRGRRKYKMAAPPPRVCQSAQTELRIFDTGCDHNLLTRRQGETSAFDCYFAASPLRLTLHAGKEVTKIKCCL